ncbi:MAG: RNA polymerase sigma factor [Rhodothermales bacterium]
MKSFPYGSKGVTQDNPALPLLTTNARKQAMSDGIRPTDEELLARARAGDEPALRGIIERYEGKVATTVIGMLGRGPEADDVGQETFIRFYKALAKFRGDSSLGTYLTRIAINQSLKALKRRRSWHERFLSRDDDTVLFDEPAEDGELAVELADRHGLVHNALQRLSPDQRAVAVLRFMEGYSTKETAAILGIPEGTVMSRLSRATDKLGNLLRPIFSRPKINDEV